ncbi:MAG: GntR family transcriptional regulator [bacterium]|nr:GntR family transcriptional regulator [bacterium]
MAVHSGDVVFDQLAGAILRGDLPAQSALPPERVFAERYGVSRIIVRQAVHRLADMGLVRVRQGGATTVLDPEEATDLRVLALFYRLAPGESTVVNRHDMIEKQYLQGLSMVSVASRRAGDETLRRLGRLVEAYATGDQKHAPVELFEEQFWRALAKAGGNRIFVMEVAWWYEVLRERPLPAQVTSLPRKTRLAFYIELTRRLQARERPVEFYLETIGPILDAMLARRA